MIELRGVSHRYPDGTVGLRTVSVTLDAGSVLAVTGPNGSGKSTLVRHLIGLLRPSQGSVLIAGRDIRDMRVARIARLVAVAMQEPDRQLFASTVGAEVEFGARNVGRPGAGLAALAAVGLLDARNLHPYDLGFGRRKLLTVACALAMETPVVVLDEPTTGVDRAGLKLLREAVAALRGQRRTVVVVTHDADFVSSSLAPCQRLELKPAARA